MAAARHGCPEAFAELVRPFSHALYRRALCFTGNHDDAEDLRQETLLRAFARLHQFHGLPSAGESQFRAWTSRIASNLSIDLLRNRRASRILHWEEPSWDRQTEWITRVAAPNADPEELCLRKEMRLRLAEAIEGLPADLRIVCVLRDVFQYSTKEVSHRLRISNVAVRLRLFRAHALLRDRLRFLQQARKVPARFRPHGVSGASAFCPALDYCGD